MFHFQSDDQFNELINVKNDKSCSSFQKLLILRQLFLFKALRFLAIFVNKSTIFHSANAKMMNYRPKSKKIDK